MPAASTSCYTRWSGRGLGRGLQGRLVPPALELLQAAVGVGGGTAGRAGALPAEGLVPDVPWRLEHRGRIWTCLASLSCEGMFVCVHV